jgi:hypothetical protein
MVMMIAISRTLLLSVALTAAPLVAAMAQANNPAGNYDSDRSATPTPGTADNGGRFGMNTGNAGTSGAPGAAGAAASATMPGNSGHTLVAPSQTNNPDATVHMRSSQSGNGNRGGQ